MIRPIHTDDAEQVMGLFTDVVKEMVGQGIDQWDDIYPDEATVRNDIANAYAFGYFDAGILAGYVALNTEYDPLYDTVDWSFREVPSLIIHRLAVKSNYQGRGIARTLMVFAESHAKEEGYRSIRLDAFSHNPRAMILYDRLGYRQAGDVLFRKGKFYCYEKRIL